MMGIRTLIIYEIIGGDGNRYFEVNANSDEEEMLRLLHAKHENSRQYSKEVNDAFEQLHELISKNGKWSKNEISIEDVSELPDIGMIIITGFVM